MIRDRTLSTMCAYICTLTLKQVYEALERPLHRAPEMPRHEHGDRLQYAPEPGGGVEAARDPPRPPSRPASKRDKHRQKNNERPRTMRGVKKESIAVVFAGELNT